MAEKDAKMDKEEWEYSKKDEHQRRRDKRMGDLLTRSIKNTKSKNSSSNIQSQKRSSRIKDLGGRFFGKNDNGTLYEAAKKHDADGFLDALERVIKEEELSLATIFTAFNQSGDGVVHVAAINGNAETVRLISENFPSLLNLKNSKGNTVWHIAAKTGNLSVFQTIFNLRAGFKDYLSYSNPKLMRKDVTWENLSLRATNEEGNTAMHEALINHREYIADKLIKEDVEVSYHPNKQKKSALYHAAEAGYVKFLEHMIENGDRSGDIFSRLKGKPLFHAAIMGRKIGILECLLKKDARFVQSDNEEGRNPLHWAAAIGFTEGVQYLLSEYSVMAKESDGKGLFPIHYASMNGNVDVIKILIQHPRFTTSNLLNSDGQNLLHVAAMTGEHNVVGYILKCPKLENLINDKDEDGNTPLQLATIHNHPKTVRTLIQDKRLNLNSVNREGMTALDTAANNLKGISSFQQWLTWQALKAAGATRAQSAGIILTAKAESSMQSESPNTPNYKGMAEILLLVSILVTLVSLGANFIVPRAYSNSCSAHSSSTGTILKCINAHMLIFCNTIAMSSSIAVAITMARARSSCDLNVVFSAHTLAKPLMVMALTMMILTLMAGAHLLMSKLHWLALAILTMAMVFLVSFAALCFPLCFPFLSVYPAVHYVTYYPILLMIFLTRTDTGNHLQV